MSLREVLSPLGQSKARCAWVVALRAVMAATQRQPARSAHLASRLTSPPSATSPTIVPRSGATSRRLLVRLAPLVLL